MALSKKEKIQLYDYLVHFEDNIKGNQGHYDFNDNQLQSFINSNDIEFCSHKSKGTHTKKHDAYFQYEYANLDRAHDLMRHIRNAIAHGNIVKSQGCFWLKDYNNFGTKTLDAKIKIDIFWDFLNELENTYH